MLTNETLRKIADEGGVLIGMNDVRPMARELLTLRSIRDAGYEEVERLRMAVGYATTIKGDMVMRADDPLGMMQEVCQHVATLTAEREEAREEIERLKEEMETLVGEAEERANERGRQIATLTAERDEFEDLLDSIPAPELNEEWIKLTGEMECLRNDLREAREEKKADMEAIDCLAGDVERLTAERDEAWEERDRFINYSISLDARHYNDQQVIARLTTELAVLRSAPGMEEVDTVVRQMCVDIEDVQGTQNYLDAKNSLIELETVLRRAIASRDEVVGLLKWVRVYFNDRLGWMKTEYPQVRRILEIVEGK